MAKKTSPKQLRRAQAPPSAAQRAFRWLADGKTIPALTWANSIKPDSLDIDELWAAGTILAQCGEILSAIDRFETIRERQPRRIEVQHMLACCHASLGDVERALGSADLTQLGAEEFCYLANAFSTGNRPAEVQLVLEQARALFPESAEIGFRLADVYALQDNRQAAIEILHARAVGADAPTAIRVRAWYNLAVMLEAENKIGHSTLKESTLTAEKAYLAAIDLDPNYPKSYINLSVYLINERRTAEAVELLAAAHKRLPENDKLNYLLAFASRLVDDFDRAISLLSAIVSRSLESEAWELLGRCYSETERHEEAIRHYQRWLSVDPKNQIATHLLAAATGESIPTRASAGYVASAFDQFAETFEATVVSKLEYQGPQIIRKLLLEQFGEPGNDGATRFTRVLDAGCGTGLMGEVLRAYAEELIGLDLSAGMLKQAADKNIYDRLLCEDLEVHLGQSQDQYGLIVAADTFNYFGDLSQLLPLCLSALMQDGWLVFTLEEGPLDKDQYFLQPHGRYVHSPAYLIEQLGECGLSGGTMLRVVLRKEANRAVYALLIAFQRPPRED